jgi:uncharacterized YccA/Bax inhibitor family protein
MLLAMTQNAAGAFHTATLVCCIIMVPLALLALGYCIHSYSQGTLNPREPGKAAIFLAVFLVCLAAFVILAALTTYYAGMM